MITINTKQFINILNCMSSISTIATLKINNNNLSWSFMGNDNISMTSGEMEIVSDEEIIINIKTTEALKFIKKIKDDNINLSVNNNRLIITTTKKKYELLLYSEDAPKETKEPPTNYVINTTCDSDELLDSLDDAVNVSTSINFLGENNKLTLTCGDKSSTRISTELTGVVVDEGVIVNCMFSPAPMLEVLKAFSKINKTFSIHLLSDYPIKLCVNNNGVRANYILAPRVNND